MAKGKSAKSSEVAPETVGAVDLGSNSFHAVIGRLVHGEIVIVDRLKEQVRLASGLGKAKQIAPDAADRALACLERFGQRLRDMDQGSVRAVGTNTLRKAKNSRDFLAAARERLGHDIEIIPGREEARLIYLGVAHTLAADDARRLVVDIGGGSTECIIGERFDPIEVDSLHMGCVSWSEKFFPGGKISESRMRKARSAAALELQPIARHYRHLGWDGAVGASGTILAIAALHDSHGWGDRGITPGGLRRLRELMIAAGHTSKLELDGLKPGRAAVLPGGLAILEALFERMRVESMTVSTGALREGVLYDLVGRIRHEDVRDRSIRALMERYHADPLQAARVKATAQTALDQVAEDWGLEGETCRQYLGWAAQLHEIGTAIAYTGHQRHGGYLVEHSDMAGFSRDGQTVLALLIRSHRRKLRPRLFEIAPPLWVDRCLRLTILLRLAVLLNRSRSSTRREKFTVEATPTSLAFTFQDGWLDEHPLARLDLEQEAAILEAAGFGLSFE